MTTENQQMLTQLGQLHDDMAQLPAAIRAERLAQIAEWNAWRDGAEDHLTMAAMHKFDPSVAYSKTSLTPVADPADDTRSKWIEMPPIGGTYINAREDQKLVLYLAQAYSFAPGYYETPQYGVDKSSSRVDFVYADYSATNEQINTRLSELQIEPATYWAWATVSYALKVPAVIGSGSKRLFVRFRNHAYTEADGVPDGTVPQPILTHGGNCVFKLSECRLFTF